MRILVVSSVPPTRCGIAAYAAQQIRRLREQGHAVEVASLDGSGEADFHFCLKRANDLAALRNLVHRSAYQRSFLHYQHDFFFDGLEKGQLVSHNLLLASLFSRGFEIICHEVVYGLLAGDCGRSVQATERLKWASARRLWVHTAHEMTRLSELLPRQLGPPIDRREHNRDFRSFRDIDQGRARAELGILPEARVLLCIGFLQRNKGFDRAIRAFARLSDPLARLYVVGSVRLPRAETFVHLLELKRLAAADPRVRLIERFLSDEQFDTWIAGADAVVVPYREIWSSGVVGRAKLLKKRVVAADVGGLSGQLDAGDLTVGAGDDLAQAMSRALEKPARPSSRRHPPLRLGVVAPWYGPGVPGGAERVIRETSERLADTGIHVEVFTTQIRDYFADWSRNARPAEEQLGRTEVHRFPVEPRRAEIFGPIAERVSRGEPLDEREREIFFGDMIRCPGLSRALAARRQDFDLFLLGHYMFATTVESARAVSDRAVVMPFLHDEGYARLAPYGEMFRRARGALFMSAPEAELAQRLFGIPADRCAVVGTGLTDPPPASRFAFARRHGLSGYVLYVGRKEEGKGFPLLLDRFRLYHATRPEARLVLIGPGGFEARSEDDGSIVDLGVVSEREKFEALAGATVLVQPSVLESFSLSIMEAWQVGRPVLVNQACTVTAHHVARALGGLTFHDDRSFSEALDRLVADPRLAARLGRHGKGYVKREFGWPEVLQRTIEALERFRAAPWLRASA